MHHFHIQVTEKETDFIINNLENVQDIIVDNSDNDSQIADYMRLQYKIKSASQSNYTTLHFSITESEYKMLTWFLTEEYENALEDESSNFVKNVMQKFNVAISN